MCASTVNSVNSGVDAASSCVVAVSFVSTPVCSYATVEPVGTSPTPIARYSFRALYSPASPRNCRANPSTSSGRLTSTHTPLVSMSSL